MRKYGKRCLCFLLALAMVLSNVSVGSVAYASELETVDSAKESEKDSTSSDVPEEETETDAEESENEDDDKSDESPADEKDGESSENTAEDTSVDKNAGDVVEDEKEEESVPDEAELTEVPEEAEEQEELSDAYENYVYGDPSYSGNYVIGTDDDGNDIYEMYSEDIAEIISMAEEGMDLERFFSGTIFAGFDLDDLRQMQEDGLSFDYIANMYLNDRELPDWVYDALAKAPMTLDDQISLYANGSGPSSLTSMGCRDMTSSAIGVLPSLGSNLSHGTVKRLLAKGDDGVTYSAFCAKYGGSYRSGWQYHQVDYSDCIAPNGSHLSANQYKLIQSFVNTYLKTTKQSNADYAAIQTVVWYVINHDASSFWAQQAWGEGGLSQVAPIMWPADPSYILGAVISCAYAWDRVSEGGWTLDNYGDVDYYPGQHAEIQFWAASNDNAQWIITWDIGGDSTWVDFTEIPYIDNSYLEEKAVTKYNVDITKESVITNELLEGIDFRVDESEASGFDLTYDIYTGTLAEYGNDYPDATINTFGQATTVSDPVPYMDADVEPSGGQHTTVVTTDQNGHADTTFVHTHTFREFYSICFDGRNSRIDYETYQALWADALAQASEAADGETISVNYKGETVEMTADEIKAIYDAQQVVYTQTQEEAQSTIDYEYDNYVARTYTYTVTELDKYGRPAATDSNGKTLDAINLPKEGYRKDVKDVTTIEPYTEVVKNGGTMIAGGKNDVDPNTNERNITNEPWYNQIFINKTDLETNSQILYDTEFEIYEYYQWKATAKAQEQSIYPAMILNQMITENGSTLKLEHIAGAKLTITDEDGTHEYLSQDLDTDKLKAAVDNPSDYVIGFTPTSAGTYKVHLYLTLDSATDLGSTSQVTYNETELHDLGTCTCAGECTDDCPVCQKSKDFCKLTTGKEYTAKALYAQKEHRINLTGSSTDDSASAVTYTTEDGGTIVLSISGENMVYTYTDASGAEKTFVKGDPNYASVYSSNTEMYFSYYEVKDTGIVLFTEDGTSYKGLDDSRYYVSATDNGDGTMTLYYYIGKILADGTYEYVTDFSVSANQITFAERDTNVGTDINDYTTWGQDNYEIVRVTPEIAKKMGWSDTTIGMYTVHRLGATDQYAGTTFTDTDDKATGEKFGYYEYGTIYYTQANLGHYCIVEKTAPADGEKTGYLGNYEDRDYTKLTDESSKKNNDGAPYDTPDQMSTVKMVHYLHMCEDTNQYATYMLTDGYKDYDNVYYTNYVEHLDDPGHTATEDGYDAHYYDQSSLLPSVGLERFTLNDPKQDTLNQDWDRLMNQYLQEKSGILVNRDSEKTDTYFALREALNLITNFVGTTINVDSYNDNDSAESEITYNGTYTDTQINYHSYAGDNAEFLNNRAGFNSTEYLQVGNVIYDDAAQEKQARFTNTEADVNKEQGYAFIDERTYGFIRFTKYDADAERYVSGTLDDQYEAGTDHGDADLDGAIYSLYVAENNTFDVDYYEGTLDGKLIWAQPLKTGGYRVIFDADNDASNGFTDEGTNTYTDYPHAYLSENKLYLDYTDATTASVEVSKNTRQYSGIQHPDGMYGGEKHNGWYAVLEEQQVFVDADEDGYGDTWTVQDVTLQAGAKVASATIKDGEFQIDGLYLGNYYLAEEIRDSIVVFSTDNDDDEASEIKWLSFAPGYLAATDSDGNPIKYHYTFPYEGEMVEGVQYDPEQVYVQKETSGVSEQQVVKGAGFQIDKETTADESASSGNTQYKKLEGAGFTVYLISELSKIVDGTIQPAFNIDEGNMLVKNNDLVALFDETDNLMGYKFTEDYILAHHPFEEKYGGTDYDLDQVNQLVYVAGRGYYYVVDILAAYKDPYYSNEILKWDFTNETNAIARMYEKNAAKVEEINKGYDYTTNHLNSGSPCEWYGLNGISDGWVATGVKNEYRLSELFSNHYGHIKSPELPWGAYLIVETTTPQDVFTVDPFVVTVTDSSATENRTKYVTETDTTIVTSLVMVKRDAQSGQDVIQKGVSYRIWNYQKNNYLKEYLFGPNGNLSTIQRDIFTTDEEGRIDAVASLEKGYYRLEELSGPEGFYNTYWDQGNPTDGEQLGGVGADAERLTKDNMFTPYYGTVDFEVTTERRYKASGITSNGNLDYIYIGETYYNKETLGKLNILKTGEVLVGYSNTDDIEYADEYTDAADAAYNNLKASAKDRAVFNQMKDHYDLGTDEVEYRTVEEQLKVDNIQKVDYLAVDGNGVRLAAVYKTADGDMLTMNGGKVYNTGVYQTVDGKKTYYPGVEEIVTVPNQYIYTDAAGNQKIITADDSTGSVVYKDETGAVVTDAAVIAALKAYAKIVTLDGTEIVGTADSFTQITDSSKILMIVYDLSTDIYENAWLRDVTDTYIYTVSGSNIMNTSYVVTEENGVLTTNDYGVLKDNGNGTYTLTYTEAIYDPDINYNYKLSLADGTILKVKLVTYGLYITDDGKVVKLLPAGGYSVTDTDGTEKDYPDAAVSLDEESTGETYDFVYEERPLANAKYQITAAEDIYTQDGNGGTWFKKGDIVATVETGEDGEIVSYVPNYKTAEKAGSGSYDYTYYYGNTDGTKTSLTGKKYYDADEYATTGSIKNYWVDGEGGMSQKDKDLYGIPAYTDKNIYPNTFYRERTLNIMRRLRRSTNSQNLIATDYVTRLENEGNITTDSAGVLTKTDTGYRLTYESTDEYPGATLKENGDYYLLTLQDGNTIEVKESQTLYRITESNVAPWAEGDIVEKTAKGYQITHTDTAEAGVDKGADVDGATDLGYTHVAVYDNASIRDNGNGSWTLIDKNGTEIVTMQDHVLVSEMGGYVYKTANGYQVTDIRSEDMTASSYIQSVKLVPRCADLVIKSETYHLIWDKLKQKFRTAAGTEITLADDYSTLTVKTGDTETTYQAFDLFIEYDLNYASQESIVKVEKDGTLGTVSVYLPLGKYNVQEIATPYGFLINNQVQTVDLKYADQIKEVVFNTNEESSKWTDDTMKIWASKGLNWFLGGVNMVAEKLYDISGVNFWTWGTYGDAEKPYYQDKNGFLSFYDLRVKAWSQEDVPETPKDDKVTISKKDLVTGKELSGAKLEITDAKGDVVESWTSTDTSHEVTLPDGIYTLTETTAPNGYERTESINFVVENGSVKSGTVTMFDAPETEDGIYISKKDITNKEELPGAELEIRTADGNEVESWTSTDTPHKTTLPDGDYKLIEKTAPDGYEKAEEISFTVKDGKVDGGYVLMYDSDGKTPDTPGGDRRPESEENQWKLGVGIYKADKDTAASLGGAKFGLYTKNDIYNVDGKLLIQAGTKLAVATTDESGHANFAVDIALMSKYLDPAAKDSDLIYQKTVSYEYDSLTAGPKEGTFWLAAPSCDTILVTKDGDAYKTADGRTLTIDTTKKTVSYLVEESIDGNTSINTGDYYIQEITPPDGYLIDDTIYPVEFKYDGEYNMYIPVYAKHANEQTEVGITKYDLTGSEEIPGAEIACYKVKNVNDVDENGLISHEDDNLIEIDRWTSTDAEHTVKGLLLSNGEWPRLNNQEVRENIYVFRELVPADGYVSAKDIEFKLYQLKDADGHWMDADGNLYGYEVIVNHVTADQDYESGLILAPNENADDWILTGQTENSWDYTEVLDGEVIAKWLLVNKNLILFVNKDATKETLAKVLRESDFADKEFEKVYFEFAGNRIEDIDFYRNLQVTTRPADSKITYTQTWGTLDDLHLVMYDDTTKVKFSKQDIVTGEEIAGAHLQIVDEKTGAVVEEWTTGDDGYDADGNPIAHYIEKKLKVKYPYILKETLAPTDKGYVKSNSISFQIDDSGEIQHIIMEDDFTKLEISKADITTGEEIAGAQMEIWTADADGNPITKYAEWTTGQDGYDANGNPNRHYVDYMPIGNYVLVEKTAPSGYLVAENVPFTITETGLLQKVQMLDATTMLKIYKYRTGTTEFVSGATINVYEVPKQYISYLTQPIKVETDAKIVDPDETPDFPTNDEIVGSTELGDYLTGVKAAQTEHRETYKTQLTLQYSLLKADLVNANYKMTQLLPDDVELNQDDLGTAFEAKDGDETAFTYKFSKTDAGYAVTVEFAEAYVNAAGHDNFNFQVTMEANIKDSALRQSGRLEVKFTDKVKLVIAKDEIVEIDSSVDTPAVTIRLTDEDLRATIVSQNKAVSVSGLKPGWYIAMEEKAPKGYILDTTPQIFRLLNATGEQTLYFYNQPEKKNSHHGGSGSHGSDDTPTPVTPTPEIGKLTLSINNGWWWNNVVTEDDGTAGYSIKVEVASENPMKRFPFVAVGAIAVLAAAGGFLIVRKKREEEA